MYCKLYKFDKENIMMILPQYWNLPQDINEWSNYDHKLFLNSFKTYHDLKLKLAEEFPDIYSQAIKKFDLIRDLSDDDDLSIILAISNKLSWEKIYLKITVILKNIFGPPLLQFVKMLCMLICKAQYPIYRMFAIRFYVY